MARYFDFYLFRNQILLLLGYFILDVFTSNFDFDSNPLMQQT